MTLVIYYSESFQKADSANLRNSKLSVCLARDVGTKGGRRGIRPSQFFADQSSLSQPGGQIMPPTLLLVPLDFQTFRQPSLLSRG